MKYTLDDFAQMIDHTNLHPYASREDMEKLCQEAREHHFRMVAINPAQVALCKKLLAGSDVHVGAAIAFPLGQLTIAEKAAETELALNEGADEIDYVINITELKAKNYAYLEDEMTRIHNLCLDHNAICKVIFENCYLTKDEIRKMAEIAAKVQPDFIKTSTGFGTSGAKAEDVKLMAETVAGTSVKVKAAGGIRNAEDFLSMIKAGASRIGTSAGVQIINDLEKQLADNTIAKH